MTESWLSPLFYVVGWMLIHFVWQAVLVGSILWLSLAFIPQNLPRLRYGAAVAALCVACLCPVFTSVYLVKSPTLQHPGSAPLVVHNTLDENLNTTPTAKVDSTSDAIEASESNSNLTSLSAGPFLPWLVIAWGLGMLNTNLRLIRSWLTLYQWKRASVKPTEDWVTRFEQLVSQFSRTWNVKLLESAQVNVPMVVGWLKPAILVPVGFLANLPVHQVEAILLHELAHVHRNDFLVNLVQSMIESVFYFHPVVTWIGRQIRIERECCCDQLAVQHCGSSQEYATALSALEEKLGGNQPSLQVAANSGSLLNRIQRLTAPSQKRVQLIPLFAFILSIAICVSAYFGMVTPAQANELLQEESIERFDSPEVNIEGKPALRIQVLDADTNEPIDSFVVVSGVPIPTDRANAGFFPPEFTQRFPDAKLANWQPHTARLGDDGEILRPLARAYNPLCLRIECRGYVPQQYFSIDKTRGAQTIVFRMQKDPGLKGQVLLPNGQPAANALIGTGFTSRQLQIRAGTFRNFDAPEPEQLRDRWSRPVIVKADADGRFVLPTEIDLSAGVAAVHPEGVCHMRFVDLAERKELQLEPWGRLVGAVKAGAGFAPNEKVSIHMTLIQGYTAPVCFWENLVSDENGKIVAERVPPGSGGWQLDGYIPRDDNPSFNDWERPQIPETALGSFSVSPGQTTTIRTGGKALGAKEMRSRAEYRINIDADGSIQLNGAPIEFDELPDLNLTRTIIINPSPSAKEEDVMRVFNKYASENPRRAYFSMASGFYPKQR